MDVVKCEYLESISQQYGSHEIYFALLCALLARVDHPAMIFCS